MENPDTKAREINEEAKVIARKGSYLTPSPREGVFYVETLIVVSNFLNNKWKVQKCSNIK
jgi:hypothetical protein